MIDVTLLIILFAMFFFITVKTLVIENEIKKIAKRLKKQTGPAGDAGEQK